jgi:sodium/potassium/calcium exchanger 6
VYIGGVMPVWAVALIIGFALAVACFFTSKHETRPAYHDAFGFIGFVMGIIWIYTLANEIVSLLKTFGIIFNINDAILGLTLLAWGNSLGDWISDTVMAKQGFARMGFSACFGGPFFNLSIGFGGAMMISQITSGDAIRYGLAMTGVSFALCSFLMLSLCFSLVFVVFIFRFKVQRVYGLCLLIIYISFLIVAVLAACNLIFNFQGAD